MVQSISNSPIPEYQGNPSRNSDSPLSVADPSLLCSFVLNGDDHEEFSLEEIALDISSSLAGRLFEAEDDLTLVQLLAPQDNLQGKD